MNYTTARKRTKVLSGAEIVCDPYVSSLINLAVPPLLDVTAFAYAYFSALMPRRHH
jgi:hypothetical protein